MYVCETNQSVTGFLANVFNKLNGINKQIPQRCSRVTLSSQCFSHISEGCYYFPLHSASVCVHLLQDIPWTLAHCNPPTLYSLALLLHSLIFRVSLNSALYRLMTLISIKWCGTLSFLTHYLVHIGIDVQHDLFPIEIKCFSKYSFNLFQLFTA